MKKLSFGEIAMRVLLSVLVVICLAGLINDMVVRNKPKTETTAYISPETTAEAPVEEESVVETRALETQKIEVTEAETEPVESITYFNVPLSEDLQDHIFAECEKHNLDPAIVISVIKRETDFRDQLVGDGGLAFGLMQIHPRWHQDRMDRLGCTDLFNPYQNVTVGIDYLAEMYKLGGTIEFALMGFNGGPDYAAEKTAKGELSDYAKYVLDYSKTLERN